MFKSNRSSTTVELESELEQVVILSYFIFNSRKYLASSSASDVPSYYVLVVFILFGQVVKEHTLCHRLKQKKKKRDDFSVPVKGGHFKTRK